MSNTVIKRQSFNTNSFGQPGLYRVPVDNFPFIVVTHAGILNYNAKFFALTGNKEDAERLVRALDLLDKVESVMGESTRKALFAARPVDEPFEEFITPDSDWIIKIGWQKATGRLRITKRDGQKLTYKDVPKEIFDDLVYPVSFGGSHGKAFNALVKGQFELEV